MSETTGFEAIDPDLLRPGRTYLRRGLFAAYLAGIAGVAVLALCEAWRPEFPYTWNVQDCLQDRELCEGSEVHLSGALVPGSLAESTPPRCFFRMEMQAPGGVPGGKLTVCSDRQSVPSALIPGGCGDKRMDRVLENGYLLMFATGRLIGTTFYATLVGARSCDSRVYDVEYGDAAVAGP